MIDQLGNFYYDSGDDYIGMVMVDNEGTLTNLYIDENTKEYSERVLGKLEDIQLELIDKVGNLQFTEPVYVAGFKDKTIPIFDPRGPLPVVMNEKQMKVLEEVQNQQKKLEEQQKKNEQ
eukprot:TRINITY_DN786_c0_g1_i4.p2 TRINITY_DN786_c0_g1~~TRINITY_DN786_c0_g1_i4.p2  ORF type:complete len:119 (-),score=20.76 TRINITY_DN786_c0_g1_i4:406-762(-)